MPELANRNEIIPRDKWWWVGLALLLLLVAWLYLRGYNVSLPYFANNDEAHHLLAAQHEIDFGHARGVFHEAYPPGIRTLNYLFLKHIKPVEAHHGTMLPALRLVSIGAWMLVIILVSFLGAMMARPLTGLMAAAVWIVNPWVVTRAHFALPDAYLTLFTLLALWLALVGCINQRRSFSTAAVYSLMLAIVFKTQALFTAPVVLLMPLLNWWRRPSRRNDSLKQVFWNCFRFAIFLFWLLLIFPTLEVDSIIYFPTSYSRIALPSLDSAWASLQNVLATFRLAQSWWIIAIACALLWRYRQRVNAVAILAVIFAGLAWLLGMSMFQIQGTRHYFAVGAISALAVSLGFTGALLLLEEALSRIAPRPPSRQIQHVKRILPVAVMLILLAASNWQSYIRSDALARSYSLPDRRNELTRYMDSSLEPGRFITDRRDTAWGIYRAFNRSWGGYDGAHDFPVAQEVNNLQAEPLETWRANGAVYAIVPYPPQAEDPAILSPDETVLLKNFPPDAGFRGPSMSVLRLYPMQFISDSRLGSLRLVGYDLNTSELSAGEDIVVRHYWRAERPTDSEMRVFNHLINQNGQIAAQADYVPLWDSRRPTTNWEDPDEVMLGREFTLSLPHDLPPGAYRLISGFYDPATGQRLRSPAGVDYVDIADIRVAPPNVEP